MSAETVVATSLETALTALQDLAGATPQRFGDGAHRVEFALTPVPIQLARAEQTLARRGYAPRLEGYPGRVRLEVRAVEGCVSLRFESFMRIGAALVELDEAQRQAVESILLRLAQVIQTRGENCIPA